MPPHCAGCLAVPGNRGGCLPDCCTWLPQALAGGSGRQLAESAISCGAQKGRTGPHSSSGAQPTFSTASLSPPCLASLPPAAPSNLLPSLPPSLPPPPAAQPLRLLGLCGHACPPAAAEHGRPSCRRHQPPAAVRHFPGRLAEGLVESGGGGVLECLRVRSFMTAATAAQGTADDSQHSADDAHSSQRHGPLCTFPPP